MNMSADDGVSSADDSGRDATGLQTKFISHLTFTPHSSGWNARAAGAAAVKMTSAAASGILFGFGPATVQPPHVEGTSTEMEMIF